MKRVESISGHELREMLATATNWLEKSASDIDALNVFPVPDGDTGTNMLLTMRSAVEEAYGTTDSSAALIARAIARGALMGARGNSGVILSQFWRGVAEGLKDRDIVSSGDMADALEEAAKTAYKGLSHPVEGTILTVAKDAASAGRDAAAGDSTDLVMLMEAVVSAASESVANTPNLLPVLKQAGVVDAGGQGLYTILEGSLRYLRGEAEQMRFRKPQIIASSVAQSVALTKIQVDDETPFGYCTEFLLKGEKLNQEAIRTRLQRKGQSLIVVGDEHTTRVHIHTLDPGNVIRYATSLGTLHQVSVRNMDEQHQDFLAMQKERAPSVDIATVGVVSGDGLADVFKSLGVTTIIPGGQTMNPSTKDILQAVKSVASDKVIILPNNKNIILTAQQVQSLTDKKVEVIPAKTVPQGIAALLALDYEADLETNTRIMSGAVSRVRTIEITSAVRSTQLNGLKIKKKQVIGLLDGELLAAGEDAVEVIGKIIDKLDMSKSEIVTIYYGDEVSASEAERVSASIRERLPNLQVEIVRGGQPHYTYIVSIE